MKIVVCPLLFTLTIILSYVESMNVWFEAEVRKGVYYGMKCNGIVYPEGTYEIRRDRRSGYKVAYWIADPAKIEDDDRLSRYGLRIARPLGEKWFQMDRQGNIALHWPSGKPLEVKVENGDKLDRGGVYVAIYEGGVFRRYGINSLHHA